ncbi:insecticidal delta-endotoxin Cry8Ea1 family protein, partial [Bacillus thuringiensis]|uniref:insecticidal delta-endotoxin Cry8Ea1 family protein n=1 Tax=Bacillus thuringiensis TaxID=1428 RepID=UPI0037CECF43
MNCLDKKNQNINYKDSLNIIKGDYQELDPSTSTRAASDAITAALSITSTMLGVLGHPIAGAILGVFNTLTGLLWPGGRNLTWEELLAEGEEIINKTITESIKNDALQQLEVARSHVDEYSNALKDWIENPGVRISAETMRSIYRSTVQQLAVQMSYFRKENYQIPLLPVYAQAANLHLVVLKDITIFGEEWEFPETDINFYYTLEFLEHIEEYTDYVVKWYKEGLNSLPKSSSTDWVAYNRYRREMTILALDIIALFPAYDGFVYPMESTTELTREVYMDPEGGGPTNWKQFPISFAQIENLIRPPHLFTWLNSLQVETDKEQAADDVWYCMWAGSLLGLHYTNSSSIFKVQNGYGALDEFYDFSGKDVYQTLFYAGSTHEAGFSEVTDFVGNEGGTINLVSGSGTTSSVNTAQCGIGNAHLIDSAMVLPPDISDPSQSLSKAYTHRLSYVTNVSYYRKQSVDFDRVELPILGWTHRNVSFDNRIYPDKITQIPAVKANQLSDSHMTVVEGPNFTGGALVKVNSTGSSRTKLRFSVKVDPNNLSQKYHLRVRMAGALHPVQTNSRHFTVSINNKGIDGKTYLSPTGLEENEVPTLYNHMRWSPFTTTFTFSQPESVIDLEFYDNNFEIGPVGPVYIDKIEFVPVNENYDERVQLEKAQKAVNALFTAGRNALQTDVTDYKVDQVSILVDCVSGELYPNEK